MSRITLVVEFEDDSDVPPLGADSEVLGGKLKKLSFHDELEELRNFENFVRCAYELHMRGELDEDEEVDLSEFTDHCGNLGSWEFVKAVGSVL